MKRSMQTDSDVRKRITAEGGMPSPTSSQGLTQFIRDETAKFEKIIKAAGVRME